MPTLYTSQLALPPLLLAAAMVVNPTSAPAAELSFMEKMELGEMYAQATFMVKNCGMPEIPEKVSVLVIANNVRAAVSSEAQRLKTMEDAHGKELVCKALIKKWAEYVK